MQPHYLQVISDDFNLGQKKRTKIKPYEIKRPKYLQYSIKLFSRSKALSIYYTGLYEANRVDTA